MEERPGGRPSAYTPELGARIVAAVARLGFISLAAELNGVSRATVHRWTQRGEKGDPEFADFAADVARAKAQFADLQLSRVDDAKWVLERVDKETFAAPRRIEVSGPDGGPIESTPRVLTQEAADLIRRRILYGEKD